MKIQQLVVSFVFITLQISEALAADQQMLKKLWVNSDTLAQPESARVCPGFGGILVSNIAGAPNEKDGKGWISVLPIDGVAKARVLVDVGLNAPKGMQCYGDFLWVADIDHVVKISLSQGKILSRTLVDGAKFLNDVTINPKTDELYISDLMTNKIHLMNCKGEISTFAEGDWLDHPNGLIWTPEGLLVATWGSPLKADFSTDKPGSLMLIYAKGSQKHGRPVFRVIGNGDGVEFANSSRTKFFISDWKAGTVTSYKKSALEMKPLVKGLQGAADIGLIYDKAGNAEVLLVPEMGASKLHAYSLK
jgi:hypothetical protein